MNIFDDFFRFKRYNLHQIANEKGETTQEDKAEDPRIDNTKDNAEENAS